MKNYITGNFIIYTLYRILLGLDGCTCSTHGADEKNVQNFSLKNPKERDYLGNLGIEGILMLT